MKKVTHINDIYVGDAKGYVMLDKCHKFYILKNETDVAEAIAIMGGVRRRIDEGFVDRFRRSCPDRFIETWGREVVVPQGADEVEFTFEDGTISVFDASAEY